MCGILAVLGQEASAVNRETLADWNDLAVHRGPDGSGVWIGAGGWYLLIVASRFWICPSRVSSAHG